ncbi:MAG: CHASE2 domain-containing protein [Acidobacteriia bacterium]|nr:CHASE2 domain-containing protein [Terriglobia bacterium]
MSALGPWIKSKWVQAVVLGLASGVVVFGADRLGWLDTVERKSLDWRFRAFTEPGRASRDIVIVALDDTSFGSREMLDNFGRWPWRRKLYAGLVHYLNECGARTIGVDIVFQGADPHAGDDALFAEALGERRNVVLACALNMSTYREMDPTTQEKLGKKLAPLTVPVRQEAALDLRPRHTPGASRFNRTPTGRCAR